ncbi:LOW QUALITY PROTEIN: uncharacterized protein LOC144750569 [Ciona intestinalis]
MKIFNKNPSTYKLLRESKLLVLPSRQRLCKERNSFAPAVGFQQHNFDSFKQKSLECKFDHEKFALLVIDEMSIQGKDKLMISDVTFYYNLSVSENVVFKKETGELVGYVDFGDEQLTSLSSNENCIANHVLVLYLRGITNKDLDGVVAYFATKSLCTQSLFFTILEAILQLEMANIKIYGDGLAVNKTTFSLLAQNETNSLSYRMKNPCDLTRYIYFIQDPPHVLKTVRNNLLSKNKKLWNNGSISWEPIRQLILQDIKLLPRRFPKLTYSHACPNSHEKMKVNLAAQVLSETVGLELKAKGYTQMSDFVLKIDHWFDLLNTGLFEYKRKLKPQLKPYTNINDERITWLTTTFPEYISNWRKQAESRSDFHESMVLSKTTEEGLIMTSKSIAGIIVQTLKNGAEYVITRRCNQDCLESYFGHQRMLGRRSTNPSLFEFGYNVNAIKCRRSLKSSNVQHCEEDGQCLLPRATSHHGSSESKTLEAPHCSAL